MAPVSANGLFVVGNGPATGKSAVALGLHQQLVRRLGRLGVFRPVVEDSDGTDPIVDLLYARAPADLPYAGSLGVSYATVHADEELALEEIMARYRALAAVKACWPSARTTATSARRRSWRSTRASR